MARMARAEVFAPDKVAVVHVMNRVVRRCYLLGNRINPSLKPAHLVCR